jgi:hypothetical protein
MVASIQKLTDRARTFAAYWNRMGGTIEDPKYVEALGEVLKVEFRDLVQQWNPDSLTFNGE